MRTPLPPCLTFSHSSWGMSGAQIRTPPANCRLGLPSCFPSSDRSTITTPMTPRFFVANGAQPSPSVPTLHTK
ncbi:hypothetical protein LY76DRAFT_588023 [Colletotrichum caudatum]|nr:hypothetical protein LY76DRAFT_588023 [Colletotrichum caudatum]